MSTAADKFSRLAALKPARQVSARPSAMRAPGEEDALGRLVGAGVASNHFGEHRAVPKLTAHLDLLHPARALWKLRLGSVRLVELERHVLDAPRLGWHREDDISSALIPQFYFDYLRGGAPEPLVGVVRHNQMDLRGLAALFGKINELLCQTTDGASEFESLDLFGLSR